MANILHNVSIPLLSHIQDETKWAEHLSHHPKKSARSHQHITLSTGSLRGFTEGCTILSNPFLLYQYDWLKTRYISLCRLQMTPVAELHKRRTKEKRLGASTGSRRSNQTNGFFYKWVSFLPTEHHAILNTSLTF